MADQTLDPSTIEDLAKSFSFIEIRKRTMQTKLCSVLCDTVSDKDTIRYPPDGTYDPLPHLGPKSGRHNMYLTTEGNPARTA